MTKFKWTHCTECGCELNKDNRWIKYINKGKDNEKIISSQLCKIHKMEMCKNIRNKSYHHNKPPLKIKTKLEATIAKIKEDKQKKIKEDKAKEEIYTFKTEKIINKTTGRLTGRAAAERVFKEQRLAIEMKNSKVQNEDTFSYNFSKGLLDGSIYL